MKGNTIIRFTYEGDNELDMLLKRLHGIKYRVSVKNAENGRKTAYIKLYLDKRVSSTIT